MKLNKIILLNICILFFNSCTNDGSNYIRTNTFADTKIIPDGFKPGDSFYISPNQSVNKFFSAEISSKIATILKNKSFVVKEDSDSACYKLVFGLAMKDRTEVRNAPRYIPDYGPWYYDRHRYHHGYSYRIIYVPEEYTVFNKILFVEVYKNNDKNIAVWQGTTNHLDDDSELRQTVDYLLVALFRHFGKNTKKYIKSRIRNYHKDVKKLREKYFKPIINK